MKIKVPVYKKISGFLIRTPSEERETYYIAGIHFTDKKSAIAHYKNLKERHLSSIKKLEEEYKALLKKKPLISGRAVDTLPL